MGNVEGRDVFFGNFDVIVCDGFVGNIVFKFVEVVGEILLSIVKEELFRGWWGKLGVIILVFNFKCIK